MFWWIQLLVCNSSKYGNCANSEAQERRNMVANIYMLILHFKCSFVQKKAKSTGMICVLTVVEYRLFGVIQIAQEAAFDLNLKWTLANCVFCPLPYSEHCHGNHFVTCKIGQITVVLPTILTGFWLFWAFTATRKNCQLCIKSVKRVSSLDDRIATVVAEKYRHHHHQFIFCWPHKK